MHIIFQSEDILEGEYFENSGLVGMMIIKLALINWITGVSADFKLQYMIQLTLGTQD
jgi:hypothetical protein